MTPVLSKAKAVTAREEGSVLLLVILILGALIGSVIGEVIATLAPGGFLAFGRRFAGGGRARGGFL